MLSASASVLSTSVIFPRPESQAGHSIIIVLSRYYLLESSEDIGVGAILGGVNNHIKYLCSTYLKINGVCSLKSLKFECLMEDTAVRLMKNLVKIILTVFCTSSNI